MRPRWTYLSQSKTGILKIQDVSVEDIAQKYGTPVYIMVESEIRKRMRRFKRAFDGYPRLRCQYASKCNSNLEILKIAREEGYEYDASSVGEIILGLLADYEPQQITYTNLYKRDEDINFAVQIGVHALTVDSYEELRRIERVGEKLNKQIRVFLRFNLAITLGDFTTTDQQYGIPVKYAKKAIDYAINSPYLQPVGFHTHMGYIENPKIYFIGAEKMIKLMQYAASKGQIIEDIDLGGGFPVKYGDAKVFRPEDMGKKFTDFFMKKLEEAGLPYPNLIFEPGKFFVANAGVGLTKIVSKKKAPKKEILVVDGSTYNFVPDALIYDAYYDILPATQMKSPRVRNYQIAGSTCDCVDFIGRNRLLPRLQENDLLAIMDIGAYSNVMASNFNTIKRAPMIMIKEDGALKMIRRRDRYSEMFAPELDVLKVADPHELKKYYDLGRINIDKIWKGKKTNGS